MWKLLSASAAGVSHLNSGQPCQDFCLGLVRETPQGSVLLVACADGAGTAEHSALGARLACESVLASASACIDVVGNSFAGVTRDQILAWFEAARAGIEAEASTLGTTSRELACTLLLAVVGETWALFAQVGDGAIVRGDGDGCRIIFWPESGQYANVTTFLTSPGFADRMQFALVAEPIDDLAVFTDGLQMLALDYHGRQAHAPFFRPMFSSLRQVEDVSTLSGPFLDFLNSDRVNERTDDDKTLLIASRCAILEPCTDPVDEPL